MLCRVPSPSNIQMIMTTDILTYVRHVVFLFPKVQIFVYIFVFLFVYSFRFFIHLFINIIYLFIYLFVIIFSISFVPYHYTIFLVQNASLFSWHPRSGCGQRTDCTFRGWGAQGNGGGHIDGFVDYGCLRTQLYGSWQLFEIILKINYVIYFVWFD